jgi:hypothetical protein
MLATTWPTTSPPRAAAWAAVPASWLAWRAVSADWVTVAVSCSMLAAVSSRLEAVCSVRADRSWLPLARQRLKERLGLRIGLQHLLAAQPWGGPRNTASSSELRGSIT